MTSQVFCGCHVPSIVPRQLNCLDRMTCSLYLVAAPAELVIVKRGLGFIFALREALLFIRLRYLLSLRARGIFDRVQAACPGPSLQRHPSRFGSCELQSCAFLGTTFVGWGISGEAAQPVATCEEGG